MTSIQLNWAALRIIFFLYIVASIFSIIGGFLTAPIMTYYIFGEWRFWRVWTDAKGLLPHAWRMLALCLVSEGYSFMFNVALTSPPASAPDAERLQIREDWPHGNSCGQCGRCCVNSKCPVLDKSTGLCLGYDSFFWRYFSCGRYPVVQDDIDYWKCPKWEFKPALGQPAISIIQLAAQAGGQEQEANPAASTAIRKARAN